MRFFAFLIVAALSASCSRDDADTTPTPVCSNGGPIRVDTGFSYFTLPSAFTPNGDGLNDYLAAFVEKIDTADFSLVVSAGGQTVFATATPYFVWAPPGYTGRRSDFDVAVKFRTQQGVVLETCGRLTIPKADSFFSCAEDISGLYFADQVNINSGAFEYPTAEQECP